MRIDGTDATFGDWRDDLARDGYAVVKGAIPKERAEKYADQMYGWLEGLSVPTCKIRRDDTSCSQPSATLASIATIPRQFIRTSCL